MIREIWNALDRDGRLAVTIAGPPLLYMLGHAFVAVVTFGS